MYLSADDSIKLDLVRHVRAVAAVQYQDRRRELSARLGHSCAPASGGPPAAPPRIPECPPRSAHRGVWARARWGTLRWWRRRWRSRVEPGSVPSTHPPSERATHGFASFRRGRRRTPVRPREHAPWTVFRQASSDRSAASAVKTEIHFGRGMSNRGRYMVGTAAENGAGGPSPTASDSPR